VFGSCLARCILGGMYHFVMLARIVVLEWIRYFEPRTPAGAKGEAERPGPSKDNDEDAML
jgi:hypothetical protein